MRIWPSAALVLLALLFCTARTSGAQEGGHAAPDQQKEATVPTNQQMEEKLQSLQKEVEELNGKIDRLERALSGQAPEETAKPAQPQGQVQSPSGAPEKEVVREQWRKLGKGVTQDEVEKILGPPEITMKVDSKTVWYYNYPNIGGGSVVFRKDGKVSDWQKPPFGWWKLW